MYDLFLLVPGPVLIVLGLIMVINPKASTKKEYRNDEKMVAKIRRNGFIDIGCGVVILILTII